MLRRRLSLWQLSLFCLLLLTSMCASVIADSPATYAQSAVNSRMLGNNPAFTHVTGRTAQVVLKNKPLTAKTTQVVSKSTHLLKANTDPAVTCTSSVVTGLSTNRNAVTFTEYTIPTASTNPYSIAQSGGTVWFVENGTNEIGQLSTSGNTTTIKQCLVPSSASNPNLQGITIGPDGAAWFTEAGVDQIGRVTISGTTASFNEYSGLASGAYPVNITTGPDGNLWFTEQGLSKIASMTTTGSLVAEYSTPTVNAGPLGIVSVGTGATGSLWFTEPFVDQIGNISTTGAITEYTGLTSGSFPFGIIAGPSNTMWFAEPGTNKIASFPIPTSGTTVTVSETAVPTANSNPNFLANFVGTSTFAFNEQSGNNTSTITTGSAPVVKEYALPTANAMPVGITSGNAADTVWIAEAGANKIAQMKLRLGNIL